MDMELTAATRRALYEGFRWSIGRKVGLLEAPAVLLGLLAEPECKAAMVLAGCRIDGDEVRRRWPALHAVDIAPPPVCAACDWEPADVAAHLSPELLASLSAADQSLADLPHPLLLATEHLLLGLVSADHEVSQWLRERNVDVRALREDILRQYGVSDSALPVVDDSPLPDDPLDGQPPDREASQTGPQGRQRWSRSATSRPARQPREPDAGCREETILRLLDASANRGREALRVVEDYARFVLDDAHLTGCLKVLRHDLTAALACLPMVDRLAMRDTRSDVGTRLTTAAERTRRDPEDVLAANFTRLQESLRSLEEFSKIDYPSTSAVLERLRYESYSLQKALSATQQAVRRLSDARLYVLIDGGSSGEAFERLVASLVEAEVDLLQLRDKRLDDRQLLDRARRLHRITRTSKTRFIVNDRPDLAVLSEADGVHVGQEELTVHDARRLVGPRRLVGVSTHSIEQARQAVLDGADYLGVGPVFPSQTKHFDDFPGMELARQVAAEIRLPAFAIGGIDETNIDEVLTTGISRVAVGGAVVNAGSPAAAARALLRVLRTPRR